MWNKKEQTKDNTVIIKIGDKCSNCNQFRPGYPDLAYTILNKLEVYDVIYLSANDYNIGAMERLVRLLNYVGLKETKRFKRTETHKNKNSSATMKVTICELEKDIALFKN